MSFTVSSAIRNHKGTMIFFLPWIFFLIHFAYGWGYLRGIVKWTTEKEKPVNITSSR
jgi:hypothetical protein